MRTRRGYRALVVCCIVVLCGVSTLVAIRSVAARAAAGAPGITSFIPTSGPLGTHVVIRGSGFTGAAGVIFGGVPAVQYVVHSDTRVTATVPWNAASGQLCIVLASGVPTCSSAAFTVTLGIVASTKDLHPGQRFTVSGSGFAPGEPVLIELDQTELARTQASGTGGFSNQPVVTPATTPAGQHTLSAIGALSNSATSVIVFVTWDWPQFHHDPAHLGLSPFENTLNTGNVSTLTNKWTTFGMANSPVEEDGVVYDNGNGDFGDTYAVDANTGAIIWQVSMGALYTSPAVDGGLVFVGSYGGGIDGPAGMYALDAKTGAMVWYQNTGPIEYSSPTVFGTTVYVGSAGGPDGSWVYALDAKTGKQKWATAVGIGVTTSPAVANGIVYVGDANKFFWALNAATGKPIWMRYLGNTMISSPAVANGQVYIATFNGIVYGLDAKTGAIDWGDTILLGTPISSSPAVANGVLYIGSDDSVLYAFDAKTGLSIWAYRTGDHIDSSPAVANGVVYVGSNDGNVYAFDAAAGTLLWSAPIGASAGLSSPAVADGALYIASNGFNLYKFALP